MIEMKKHKVLFITQRGLRHQQAAIDSAPAEFEIIMRRDPRREEILGLLPKVEFFISERSGDIDADLFAAGSNLRLVQRLGRQTWDIDLSAAQRAGVPVCCQPIVGCQLVAEHMILQTLALVKRLHEVTHVAEAAGDWGQSKECTEDYFAYNWSHRDAIGGLFDKTVGILGFGEIGMELACRLCAFDCNVLYQKRKRLPLHAEAELQIEYASPADIQLKADVICNLLPDLPETYHLISASFLAACRKGAMLVHAGGGTTVDEQAVANALQSGQFGGAALDTYNWEPLRPDDPLVSLVRDPQINLLLTPHTAAGARAEAGAEFQRNQDYDNLLAILSGQPLKHRVV
jgi:phosphoglycerate dehydrogenase-like enzyme